MPNAPTNQSGFAQKTVPQIISTKDSQYLKDQMSWLLLAAKKCAHFAKEAQDPAVKQAMEQIGQMHQRHYTQLLGHLNIQNSQNTQNTFMAAQGQTAAAQFQNTTRQ